MKRNFYILTLLTVLLCNAQNKQKTETIVLPTGKNKLTLYEVLTREDPGRYTKLDITGSCNTSYIPIDIWDNIPADFLKENKNAVASQSVFVRTEKNHTILLLFGFFYGTGYDEITLISIEGSKTHLLHDNELETPIAFKDLDNDNKAELICHNEPEMISEHVSAYSPYIVYSITANSFTKNLQLTEQYNKIHYVWAGAIYREDIKVALPNDPEEKYRIIK
ncbi:hypothetical protein ACLI1A_16540 [Flavobacterium sp. RHBU_3]|uniref:hypothetical protein n=1 Tax=Flavobacterium sp. RHBU_3 TaxID=3391184 RepID=UPI003985558E